MSTINTNPETPVRITFGLLALAAGVLACLQTYLQFSERAEAHRQSGAKYGALLKEIDQIMVIPPRDDHDLDIRISALRERWDKLSLEAPTIPEKIWEKHGVKVSEESHKKSPTERSKRPPDIAEPTKSPAVSTEGSVSPDAS